MLHGMGIVTGLAVVAFVAPAGSVVGVWVAPPVWAPRPTEAEAVVIAETAIGQRPANIAGPPIACAWLCWPQWQPGGDQVAEFDDAFDNSGGVDHSDVVYRLSDGEARRTVAVARTRLTAAGWRVRESGSDADVTAFQADKDGVRVRVMAGLLIENGPLLTLWIERPAPFRLAAITGAVIGAVAGGAFYLWIVRRFRRQPPRRKAITVAAALPLLAIIVYAEVMLIWFARLTAGFFLGNVPFPDPGGVPVAVAAFASGENGMFPGAWAPPVLLAALAVIVVLAALPLGNRAVHPAPGSGQP